MNQVNTARPPHSPPRVLVVDDETAICQLIERYFGREGFEVVSAGDGEAMRAELAKQPVDLVLLDVRLPGEDGFSLARWLRERSEVAIVMLTAKDDLIDRVAGLESGADDYLPKPFHPRELLARARAVLRRTTARREAPPAETERQQIHFDGCCLDLDRRSLSDRDGQDVCLSPTEFDLLQTLASQPNRALSRDQLMDAVCNREAQPFDRAIDMHISHLRKKLERDPKSPKLIRTVRGVGYRFGSEED